MFQKLDTIQLDGINGGVRLGPNGEGCTRPAGPRLPGGPRPLPGPTFPGPTFPRPLGPILGGPNIGGPLR